MTHLAAALHVILAFFLTTINVYKIAHKDGIPNLQITLARLVILLALPATTEPNTIAHNVLPLNILLSH